MMKQCGTHIQSGLFAIIAGLALGAGGCSHSNKPTVAAAPSPATAPETAAKTSPANEPTNAEVAAKPAEPRPEDSAKAPNADPGWPKAIDKPLSVMRTPNGVVQEEYVLGTGMPTLPGGLVTIHFVARVKDGEMFQSTYGAGEPETHLTREFVPGLAEGIIGMRKGGKRRLIIPPAMAFGEAGIVNDKGEVIVPPKATVMFDVELVDLKQSFEIPKGPSEPKMQSMPMPRP